MLEVNGGLESILSFLTAASTKASPATPTKASPASYTEDETFFKNNLKSCMKVFGRDRERVLRILIATLNSLSQVDDRQLRLTFTQKSQDLIESMFKMIKNNTEFSSDLAFSIFSFLSKNSNDEQCENGFEAIPMKIKDYLNKSVDDFNNKNTSNDLKREKRDIVIGKKRFEKQRFYALDIDTCGIVTTLNVILDSLAHLVSKTSKKKNFKSLIYTELKGHLDIVLEKGSTGEKRLVLEIYKNLACDQEIGQKFFLSKEIKHSILENKRDYEELLENTYRSLMYLLGQNCETKESYTQDNQKTSSTGRMQDFIYLGYNRENEAKCKGLKKRLEDTFHYSVELHNIEDDEGKFSQWKGKCFILFLYSKKMPVESSRFKLKCESKNHGK